MKCERSGKQKAWPCAKVKKKKLPSNKKNYKHNDILFVEQINSKNCKTDVSGPPPPFPGNNNKAPGTPDTLLYRRRGEGWAHNALEKQTLKPSFTCWFLFLSFRGVGIWIVFWPLLAVVLILIFLLSLTYSLLALLRYFFYHKVRFSFLFCQCFNVFVFTYFRII